MTREEAIEYIRYCMCEGRLVGNTTPIIDEKWQAGIMAIKALEQEPILDEIRAEIEALIEWHDCPIEYDNGNDAWYCEACNQALKIIDKYKIENEDKE